MKIKWIMCYRSHGSLHEALATLVRMELLVHTDVGLRADFEPRSQAAREVESLAFMRNRRHKWADVLLFHAGPLLFLMLGSTDRSRRADA